MDEDYDDLAMMREPLSWPMMMLPLKRLRSDGNWPDHGVLRYNVSQNAFYFYPDQNLYEPLNHDKQKMFTPEQLGQLTAEGWIVD